MSLHFSQFYSHKILMDDDNKIWRETERGRESKLKAKIFKGHVYIYT